MTAGTQYQETDVVPLTPPFQVSHIFHVRPAPGGASFFPIKNSVEPLFNVAELAFCRPGRFFQLFQGVLVTSLALGVVGL